MLLHHAHGAFADFSRKLVRLVHSSILSRVGASTKSGAVQFDANDEEGQQVNSESQAMMSHPCAKVSCLSGADAQASQ
ncbi:hypothetical protein Y023_4966 [Burkholderia pseudomallei A79D]|nr:hypothetical protein Y023_4966 [Burkholderia pseudomallei A79D]KGX97837.1 hypothetical protein X997_4641 [Burkholderia pseudomallei A79C]